VREEPRTTEELAVIVTTLTLVPAAVGDVVGDPDVAPSGVGGRPVARLTAPTPAANAVLTVSDPHGLDAAAAVLAVSCALHLRAIADRGGPSAEEHVEQLRRMLVRREGRRAGLARRRQIRHAVRAAATGRPGAILPGERQPLVRDLRALDRALSPAARVGG
jgi:hypothetical protein